MAREQSHETAKNNPAIESESPTRVTRNPIVKKTAKSSLFICEVKNPH